VDAEPELSWYHTLELPSGTTKGFFDLRSIVSRVLPADLKGKRCLDACSASGFWAFEMEKRGASSVVSLDILRHDEEDWRKPWLAPSAERMQPHAFRVAKEALGSSVERVEQSVYDVAAAAIGSFDFVFIGSVLLHLRDPVLALRALRGVTAGELVSFEPVLAWSSLLHPRTAHGWMSPGDDARWWTANATAHRQWLIAGGFDVVEGSWHRQPFGPLHPVVPRRVPRSANEARWVLFDRHVGLLTRRLLARPNPAA
jgi:tRNA (mo5U34)-methyltransferase